jgi:hypothetical protein
VAELSRGHVARIERDEWWSSCHDDIAWLIREGAMRWGLRAAGQESLRDRKEDGLRAQSRQA